MREIHGVADAIQEYVGGPKEVPVRVIDGKNGKVVISVDGHHADLTPEQANHIAAALSASANRVKPAPVVIPRGTKIR